MHLQPDLSVWIQNEIMSSVINLGEGPSVLPGFQRGPRHPSLRIKNHESETQIVV